MNYLEKRQLLANQIARQHGRGSATQVVLGDSNVVLDSTDYGYRKHTTGEYVAKAYLRNFGWRNTYYQRAQCTVQIRPTATDDPASPYNQG